MSSQLLFNRESKKSRPKKCKKYGTVVDFDQEQQVHASELETERDYVFENNPFEESHSRIDLTTSTEPNRSAYQIFGPTPAQTVVAIYFVIGSMTLLILFTLIWCEKVDFDYWNQWELFFG